MKELPTAIAAAAKFPGDDMKGTMILTESEKETDKYCYYIKNAPVTERKTERYKN